MWSMARQQWNQLSSVQWLFGGLSLLVLGSIGIGVATELYFLAGIPLFFLMLYWTIVDFRQIFFFLVAFLPLSTEIYLPGGLGTDLPTEPLMVGLLLVYILFAIKHFNRLDASFFLHPITLLLGLHLVWTLVTTVTSSLLLVSIKFLLAKIWYVTSFYFLASLTLTDAKSFKRFFGYFFIPPSFKCGCYCG